MKVIQRLQHKLPLLPILIGALLLLIYTVTRVGLVAYVGIDSAPLHLWPGIFAKGLWFDIAVASALLAPVFLYEALLPNRWRSSRMHQVLRLTWLWVSVMLLLFGAVAEVTFWMEFSTRFNFIALDYLIYTQEVIGNIRESYPVGGILAAIAILAAVIVRLLLKSMRHADSRSITRSQRIGLAVAAVVLPSLGMFTANIDQMEGQGNAYAAELSGNGLFTIAAAMRRNELDYDKFYLTIPQETANAALQKLGVKREPLYSIVRGTTARARVVNLREAGAKEVHMRISCPPHRHACHYGIDFPDPEKLIANQHTLDEIRDYLGADSIGYLDVGGMVRATGQDEKSFCLACFNGKYPIPVDPKLDKYIMERRAHRANLLAEEEHPELFEKVT